MIYLLCKYDIISVPSYAEGIYHRTTVRYHIEDISPVPQGTDIIVKNLFCQVDKRGFLHGPPEVEMPPCVIRPCSTATADFETKNSPQDCFLNASHPLRVRIPNSPPKNNRHSDTTEWRLFYTQNRFLKNFSGEKFVNSQFYPISNR